MARFVRTLALGCFAAITGTVSLGWARESGSKEPASSPISEESAQSSATTSASTGEPAQVDAPATQHRDSEKQEAKAESVLKPSPIFLIGLLWDIAVPVGSSADWIGKASARGLQVDFRYFPKSSWGLGGSIAWNVLAQKEFETLEFGDATLSGTQVHELSSTTLLGKGFYAWRRLETVIPYVSLGLGGSYATRRLDAGIGRWVMDKWHVAVVPEAGAEIPLPTGTLLVAARFNYLFKTGEAPEQLFFSFGLGWGFR